MVKNYTSILFLVCFTLLVIISSLQNSVQADVEIGSALWVVKQLYASAFKNAKDADTDGDIVEASFIVNGGVRHKRFFSKKNITCQHY